MPRDVGFWPSDGQLPQLARAECSVWSTEEANHSAAQQTRVSRDLNHCLDDV